MGLDAAPQRALGGDLDRIRLFRACPHFATATQLRNRRFKQREVSARLARVERDHRTTLSRKCEPLRLAI